MIGTPEHGVRIDRSLRQPDGTTVAATLVLRWPSTLGMTPAQGEQLGAALGVCVGEVVDEWMRAVYDTIAAERRGGAS